jgi:uncharacterized phage protein gp47/JayE
MSGTISSTAPTIDGAGIHVPTFEQILTYVQGQFQTIYGADIYLENDSQDGQLVGVLAKAISDSNSAIVAVYNSYSPKTAQGVGLSSIIKTNGIRRLVPSNSTVDLLITGDVGKTITNGVATDGVVQWALPTPITIPTSGFITVTATASQPGDFSAVPNSINQIATPTRGWVSVNNPANAVEGNPVETDAALRMRQSVSVALPSQSPLDGIIASVSNLAGVEFVRGYENDTDITDANGIPEHSIALVVQGGDSQAIANAIALQKTIGAATFGTTSETVIDGYGISKIIKFFRPTEVPVFVTVDLTALAGYTSNVGTDITDAIVAWFAPFNIGQPSLLSKLYTPANLAGPESNTYNITAIKQGTSSGAQTPTDLPITFSQVATIVAGNVTIVAS